MCALTNELFVSVDSGVRLDDEIVHVADDVRRHDARRVLLPLGRDLRGLVGGVDLRLGRLERRLRCLRERDLCQHRRGLCRRLRGLKLLLLSSVIRHLATPTRTTRNEQHQNTNNRDNNSTSGVSVGCGAGTSASSVCAGAMSTLLLHRVLLRHLAKPTPTPAPTTTMRTTHDTNNMSTKNGDNKSTETRIAPRQRAGAFQTLSICRR